MDQGGLNNCRCHHFGKRPKVVKKNEETRNKKTSGKGKPNNRRIARNSKGW
jgi:hypothetical protein